MHFGLIQTKQNALYDFSNTVPLELNQTAVLQKEMAEQNYRLIQYAGIQG